MPLSPVSYGLLKYVSRINKKRVFWETASLHFPNTQFQFYSLMFLSIRTFRGETSLQISLKTKKARRLPIFRERCGQKGAKAPPISFLVLRPLEHLASSTILRTPPHDWEPQCASTCLQCSRLRRRSSIWAARIHLR